MGELSMQDKAISDIIASQPGESSIHIKDYLKPHDFDLPKECEPFGTKYDFRWLSKDTRILDRAVHVKGWTIVNRTCSVKLPDYMFQAHGAVEKRGMILGFRAKEIGETFKKIASSQSIDNIKTAMKKEEKDKKDSPFYTAKLTSPDSTDEAADGLVQGRDF